MPGSRFSGVRKQQELQSLLARVRAKPVSRLSFQRRAPTPANPVLPARSFVPSLTRRDSARSLPEPRLGSRLHTRFTAPPPPPPAPTARPSFIRHNIARFASDKLTARSGPVRQDKPVKSVSFDESVTVHPVTRWINNPVKHVHFFPTVEVFPVTRWIDPKKHITPRPVRRSRLAQSTAHVGTAGKASAKPEAPAKGGRKAKPTKHVHFGETTTHTVTRWIDPILHVSRLPSRARDNRLTGWSVIPFSKPDKYGEEARYIASWGSGPYAMLPKHASKPCDHGQLCSYNVLAGYQSDRPDTSYGYRTYRPLSHTTSTYPVGYSLSCFKWRATGLVGGKRRLVPPGIWWLWLAHGRSKGEREGGGLGWWER
ncbi:hypothetical protein BJX64DRAFT_291070 [Aspergillus heterothallicus]